MTVHPPTFGAPRLRPEWTPALLYATTLSLGLGTLMIVAPRQFVGPAYSWINQSLGAFAVGLLLTSSLGAFAALRLVPARLLPLVLIALAAPLLALGVGFATVGLVGGPIFYGADAAVLTWMGISLVRRSQPARPLPLRLTVSIGQVGQGFAMLLFPSQYANPIVFGDFPTYRSLIAVCWILAGGALLYSQFRPEHRRWAIAALVFAAVNYSIYPSFFVATRAWTGVIAYSSVVPFLLLAIPTRPTWRTAAIVFAGLAGALALVATVVVPAARDLTAVGLVVALVALVCVARLPLVSVYLVAGSAAACVTVSSFIQVPNALVVQGAVGVAVAAVLLAGGWRWSAHSAAAIGTWLLGVSFVALLVQIIDLRISAFTGAGLDFGTNAAILLSSLAIVVAALPRVQRGVIGGRVFAGLGAIFVLVVLRGQILTTGQAAALNLAITDPVGSALVASASSHAASGLLLMIAAAILVTGVVTTRTITTPLAGMVDAMERFGRGDRSARLANDGVDEIGRAQRAFNGMADELDGAQTELRAAHDELAALNADLEVRVERRTAELTAATRELEAFSYSVSHDLRGPLRSIDGFSQALVEDFGPTLGGEAKRYLGLIRGSAQEMGRLIDDLLRLALVSRSVMRSEPVDFSKMAEDILVGLQESAPDRHVVRQVEPGLGAVGDPPLLRAALENLLANAWKFTGKRADARIEVGRMTAAPAEFYVRDNGVGFDPAYAGKLFGAFQRLHAKSEFEGTGIGLATVRRVVRRHGGEIRAESAPGAGATFFFTLAD